MNEQSKPDPDKVWELAVELMAGQGIPPKEAVERVLEARESTLLHLAQPPSEQLSASILLGKPAATIWKMVTGKPKRSDSWSSFPDQVRNWCKDRGIREDLIDIAANHLEKIVPPKEVSTGKVSTGKVSTGKVSTGKVSTGKATSVTGPVFFPDDPIMHFVVDLLLDVFQERPLRLGQHANFFDLTAHTGTEVVNFTFREDTLAFEQPVVLLPEFEEIAEAIFSKISSPTRGRSRPIYPTGSLPIALAFKTGVKILHSDSESCPVKEIRLSTGTKILPGFRPSVSGCDDHPAPTTKEKPEKK